METPRPWQLLLNKILEEKPSARRVIWLVDPLGGSGKSEFVRYYTRMSGGGISFPPDKEARQMKKILIEKIKYYIAENNVLGEPLRKVFVTIPKNTSPKSLEEITSVLEELKDGTIDSCFGEFKTVDIPPVHVVVMSNTIPGLQTLSSDRWEIYWIGNKDYQYLMQPVKTNYTVTYFDPDLKLVTWVVNLTPTIKHHYIGDIPPDDVDQVIADMPPDSLCGLIEKHRKTIIPAHPFPEILEDLAGRNERFQDKKEKTWANMVPLHEAPICVKSIVSHERVRLIKQFCEKTGDWTFYDRMARHQRKNDSDDDKPKKKKPKK